MNSRIPGVPRVEQLAPVDLWLRWILPPVWTVAEVCGTAGEHSLASLDRVLRHIDRRGGTYHLFLANGAQFWLLEPALSNFARTHFVKTDLQLRAVGDGTQDWTTVGAVEPGMEEMPDALLVPVITLDEYFRAMRNWPDILLVGPSCDAAQVLQGFARSLQHFRPGVLFVFPEEGQDSSDLVAEVLQQTGYVLFHLETLRAVNWAAAATELANAQVLALPNSHAIHVEFEPVAAWGAGSLTIHGGNWIVTPHFALPQGISRVEVTLRLGQPGEVVMDLCSGKRALFRQQIQFATGGLHTVSFLLESTAPVPQASWQVAGEPVDSVAMVQVEKVLPHTAPPAELCVDPHALAGGKGWRLPY